MAEPFTIYKLTILNMLDKVDFPLTNTQISNFFLEQDYTDYFRVQQVISDLVDADLIRTVRRADRALRVGDSHSVLRWRERQYPAVRSPP